ncbi:MAG: response regulator [Deltaproteobacteria bacterium]|nr:response regulator [Deltaproteobacteria bacterium]
MDNLGTASEPASRTIPEELIGREVSARALSPFFEAARRKGLDPERLANGTGYDLAQLRSLNQRISWAAFARLMANLGEVFNDEELVELGSSLLDSPYLRVLVVPARLLFSLADTYRWAFSPGGPAARLVVGPETRILEVTPGLLRIEVRMRPGYAPSRENHLVLQGVLHGLARFFGAHETEVTQRSLPDGAVFDIRIRRKTGALASLRSSWTWLRTAWSVGDELRRAHEELDERYLELQREIAERNRSEAERQRLEAQLLQAQKLEALGRLAGGVAHDFNNLLQVILGQSGLLLLELPNGHAARAGLEEIEKAAQRAAGLTRQLLAFSRQQVVEPQVLDPNEVVTELGKMLRRLVGEDVELAIVARPGVGRVKADRGQLEQVVLNLVLNARDAMPRGGKLTLETDHVVLDAAYERGHLGAALGPHVLLAVSDTGIGMDAATQTRIFEPFFTTKPKGKGTGLGLATVFGIVKQAGGSVGVYSEPGRGTTFKVYLPCTEEEPTTAASLPDLFSTGGSETILVVEDDAQVRAVTREVLLRGGYRLLEAATPEAALAAARAHAGEIDLLLSDVVLPQMNGRELAELLLLERPRTKVIYMSGFTADAISGHDLLRTDAVLLQKPASPELLLRRVREALDARP